MISSAVIVPEQESGHLTNSTENGSSDSPSLKRKLSHSLSTDRKRPKVDTDTDTLNYDDATKSASPEDVRPRSTAQHSPQRRRPAPAVEEKKRNQRLFGSLLGTLSQSNTRSNPAHRKRDEIEARQRERLKREHEEQESARRRKKEDLAKKRGKEQRYWEEESQRLKHANMRAMAGFLRTKTEPVLHYLPWELRQEEEAVIQRQKDEAETLVQLELGDVRQESAIRELAPEAPLEEKNGDHETSASVPLENGTPNGNPSNDLQQRMEEDNPTPADGKAHENADTADDHARNSEPKEDDHHADELVEGQEDEVIY